MRNNRRTPKGMKYTNTKAVNCFSAGKITTKKLGITGPCYHLFFSLLPLPISCMLFLFSFSLIHRPLQILYNCWMKKKKIIKDNSIPFFFFNLDLLLYSSNIVYFKHINKQWHTALLNACLYRKWASVFMLPTHDPKKKALQVILLFLSPKLNN